MTGDIVEVDRLGRRFYALVTGSIACGLGSSRWTAVSPTGGVEPTRSLGVARAAAVTAQLLEPSALQLQLDTVARDWALGGPGKGEADRVDLAR